MQLGVLFPELEKRKGSPVQVATRLSEGSTCPLFLLDRESQNGCTLRFVLQPTIPEKSLMNHHRPTKIPVELTDLNDSVARSTLAVGRPLSMGGFRKLLIGAGCGDRAEDRQEACGSGSGFPGFPEERRAMEANRA